MCALTKVTPRSGKASIIGLKICPDLQSSIYTLWPGKVSGWAPAPALAAAWLAQLRSRSRTLRVENPRSWHVVVAAAAARIEVLLCALAAPLCREHLS